MIYTPTLQLLSTHLYIDESLLWGPLNFFVLVFHSSLPCWKQHSWTHLHLPSLKSVSPPAFPVAMMEPISKLGLLSWPWHFLNFYPFLCHIHHQILAIFLATFFSNSIFFPFTVSPSYSNIQDNCNYELDPPHSVFSKKTDLYSATSYFFLKHVSVHVSYA